MHDDRFLTCTSCGIRFVWLAAETSSDTPTHCPGCRFILPGAGRQRGVVKFYSIRKKWGFITQPDGKEVFFHRSAASSQADVTFQEGDLVEYAVEVTGRGAQAIELVRLALLDGVTA